MTLEGEYYNANPTARNIAQLVAILMTLEGEYYLLTIRPIGKEIPVAILMTLEGEYYIPDGCCGDFSFCRNPHDIGRRILPTLWAVPLGKTFSSQSS